jgi:hypothetical protein
MGSFYTNITLRGPDKDAVLEVLRRNNLRAYVSQTRDHFTVVYDLETESQDEELVCHITELLSREFACPALAVLNHDDDLLAYYLYVCGDRVDSYNSAPGYFEGAFTPPSGGNIAVLIETFDAHCDPEVLASILHSPVSAGEGWNDIDQSFAVGFYEWTTRILSNPSLVAQLLTGQLSDESLKRIGKMRDEIFPDVLHRASHGTGLVAEDKYLFALDRHRDLARTLDLPLDAVGGGYNYIEDGQYPEGTDRDDFVHT